MKDRSRSSPTLAPAGTISARPVPFIDGLPDLVESALAAPHLAQALASLADWWCDAADAAHAAIAVMDDWRQRVLIGLASADAPPRYAQHDLCLTTADASVQSLLTQALGTDAPTLWFPLKDRGRPLGGLALWTTSPPTPASGTPAPSSAAIPAVALDLTARLLASTRDREQQLQLARLESLAEFSAGAGHEINNPLGTILGRVQLLGKQETDPERRRQLATIGAQALRVRDMIGDVMLFARPPLPQLQPVDFAATAAAACRPLMADCAAHGLTVELPSAPGPLLSADPVQLAIVVTEMLRNALMAAPRDGRFRIEATTDGLPPGRPFACLRFLNDGPPLTLEEQQHALDPFYSARQAGRGLGFGLSKCWRIITHHGGCLHVANTPPGVCWTTHWPLAHPTAPAAPHRP